MWNIRVPEATANVRLHSKHTWQARSSSLPLWLPRLFLHLWWTPRIQRRCVLSVGLVAGDSPGCRGSPEDTLRWIARNKVQACVSSVVSMTIIVTFFRKVLNDCKRHIKWFIIAQNSPKIDFIWHLIWGRTCLWFFSSPVVTSSPSTDVFFVERAWKRARLRV